MPGKHPICLLRRRANWQISNSHVIYFHIQRRCNLTLSESMRCFARFRPICATWEENHRNWVTWTVRRKSGLREASWRWWRWNCITSCSNLHKMRHYSADRLWKFLGLNHILHSLESLTSIDPRCVLSQEAACHISEPHEFINSRIKKKNSTC